MGSYRGTVQTDGYEAYNTFEGAPDKRMLGCWAHVRRKFAETLDEDRKHASEALVYICKLYELEANMNEAGMSYDQKRALRQEKAYHVIQEFEKWLISKVNAFGKNSRMAKAVGYTYALAPVISMMAGIISTITE
ncbi:MAG: transposase [Bacteroidales bacterium]|nr:transposase [Bacteroidales bacterium]